MLARVVVPAVDGLQRGVDAPPREVRSAAAAGPDPDPDPDPPSTPSRRRREEALHRARDLRHPEQALREAVVRQRPAREAQKRANAASVDEDVGELTMLQERAQRRERLRELREPSLRGRARSRGLLQRPRVRRLGAPARVARPVRDREAELDGAARQRLPETFDVLADGGERAHARLREPRRELRDVQELAHPFLLHPRRHALRRGVIPALVLFAQREEVIHGETVRRRRRRRRRRRLRGGLAAAAPQRLLDDVRAVDVLAVYHAPLQRRDDLLHYSPVHERGRDVLLFEGDGQRPPGVRPHAQRV